VFSVCRPVKTDHQEIPMVASVPPPSDDRTPDVGGRPPRLFELRRPSLHTHALGVLGLEQAASYSHLIPSGPATGVMTVVGVAAVYVVDCIRRIR
jgi:hypothetical protein